MTPPVRPSAAPPGGHRWRTGEAGSAAVAGWPWLLGRAPKGRLRRWWLNRHPSTDTWTLNQRNVYILPTKGGVVFGLTLVVMLLASINYQLNLGYVLTFLLTGSGLVSIHMTHNSLRGLTLRLRPTAPVFAGEPAQLEVVLSNPGAARHGLALHFHDRALPQGKAWCDVPALGQASARLSIVPATRGWHTLPALVVETQFPFGLFRAWTIWRPAGNVLAYPRPEQPAAPLPASQPAPGDAAHARQGQGSELDGVRAWRRGDSLRQVVWKKVARSGQLVSRETTADSSRELWLDWQATSGATRIDTEGRLSRLAAWVVAADKQGLVYGLRLPGQHMPPDHGDAQLRAALQKLALWS